jgi:hypothetical protein
MRKWRRYRSVLLALVLGAVWLYSQREKSPSIPARAKTVTITLNEPSSGNLIVEKTVSDRAVIDQLVATLSLATSAKEHKCPSLGTITFVTEAATTTVGILPGHDTDFYEFREGGALFQLSRGAFIDCLVAAGVNREEIPLDEHPEGAAGPVPPAG